MPGRYTLTHHSCPVDRTTWWKDENHKEPADVWWLSGPGISRPATDIEVDLWRQAGEKALAAAAPFDSVNRNGRTVLDGIREAFGLPSERVEHWEARKESAVGR